MNYWLLRDKWIGKRVSLDGEFAVSAVGKHSKFGAKGTIIGVERVISLWFEVDWDNPGLPLKVLDRTVTIIDEP